MMFVTVLLNILAITTAIRVPTVWPDQEKLVPRLKLEQNTYISDGNELKTISNQQTKSDANKATNKGFYTPKLEQQITDAAYVPHFAQHKRRPSGSHAEFVFNNKKSQHLNQKYNIREPDVSYSVHHFTNNERSPTVLHANVVTKNNNKGFYNRNIDQNQDNTKQRYNSPTKSSFSQPVVYVDHNVNFPTSADGWMPITGQHSSHKVQELNNVYPHHNLDRRRNQISNILADRRHSSPLNLRRQYKNPNKEQDARHAPNYQSTLQHYRVTNKNYRDDKTHEPSGIDEIAEIQDENDNLENVKGDVDKLPASDHESPRDIPTKPVYPGEGQWATPGLKHQPFVSNHHFTHLIADAIEKPEGYETFQNAAPSFERQINRFSENLQSFPQKHAVGEYIDDKREENEEEDHEDQKDADEEAEEDDGDDSFVPTRTLAQVRKTENEEHLPSSPEDARLREVIKDSKIHTVYTEEGYEDIAYDHEGHEKNAEDSEGHEEFDKNAKQKIPRGRKPKHKEINIAKEFENYEEPTKNGDENSKSEETPDVEVSASSYENPNPSKNIEMKKFSTTKENKTTKIKNMGDGDMELEITSEIKIMMQPNNVSTAHKFVKIVPKSKNKVNINDKKLPDPNSDSSEILKRRKRFLNDFPKIDVEKDFLDVLHSDKQRVSPVVSTEKYPYYTIKNANILNKNSPLRYAEDMKNIPKKISGRMTFYEQSKISECPEIPQNVNPIPDRVQQAQNKAKKGEENQENEESGGVLELPNVPRLQNLGDKIDCLKLKLFGENPLDSPIFQESVVEPPESIFDELDSLGNLANIRQETDSPKSEESFSDKPNEDYRAEEEQEEQSGETYSASAVNEDYDDNDADYQTVVHETLAEVPEATSNITSNNTFETTSEKNSVEQLPVSTTAFAINVLPTQYDENINLIPKHIYDQIDFAQNLEVTTSAAINDYTYSELLRSNTTTENAKINTVSSEAPLQDQIGQTTEKLVSSTAISNNNTTAFIPRHIYDQIDFLNNLNNTTSNESNFNVTTNAVEIQKLTQTGNPASNTEENINTTSNRQPKAFEIVMAPNLSNVNESRILNLIRKMDNNETLPESAALRMRRRRRKRPQMPLLQVFDVNRFLPTPLPDLPIYPTTNTVLPKYKTLSEVYYKDEIKPNEQLNVFADVINNIKNSPPETLHAESSENFATVEEDTWNFSGSQKSTVKKLKVPPRKVRIKQNDATKNYHNSNNALYITSSTTTTTTVAPRRRRKNKYKNHKPSAQVYEEYLEAVKENGKDHSTSSSHGKNNKVPHIQKPLVENVPKDSYISEDTSYYNPVLTQHLASGTVIDDVLGLDPPLSVDLPSVYPPINNQNLYSLAESSTLNTFLVPGMKPPSNRKPLLYSDFRLVQHNRIRRRNNYHRIHKRSPYKPSYSEIRRNKPVESSSEEQEEKVKEDEEDDYVPKRNRNFHYDVENDRVVYTNKKDNEEDSLPEPQVREQEEEEEEEEGVEYLTLKPSKPKFVVITTERNGPSFLEYVQQLKNNSDYRVILDPQPTKKSTVEATTKSDLKEGESTTTKQVETIIPAFLSIVSKLKSDEGYEEIKDKKAKSTTTASPNEEVEDEEVDEPNIDVRNSPGASQSSSSYDRSQIFDISEYLPQPKTAIDYSKYKTIERAPVSTRHNLSSRYNSENDDLPLSSRDTTQIPILATSEDNVQASSSEKLSNHPGGTRRSGYSSSEEIAEEKEEVTTRTTTELPEVTTTRPKRIRMRGRKRPTTTTSKPTTTTTSPVTSRRRTRFRSRPTTTTESTLEENYSQTQRVVHRRLPIERYSRQNQNIPHNHKAFYTPIVIEEEADADSRSSVIQRKRKVSRLATPDQTQLPTNSTNEKLEELGKPGEIQPRKLPEVQVFRKYDPNQKHGGNYRREHEGHASRTVNPAPITPYEIENSKEILRLSDVVPKPFAFYSDPTLPKSVNQLKEPKTAEDLPTDSGEAEALPNPQEKTNKDYNVDYDDEVKINFNRNLATATKKPVNFVKDPSKRLYYYAPVK